MPRRRNRYPSRGLENPWVIGPGPWDEEPAPFDSPDEDFYKYVLAHRDLVSDWYATLRRGGSVSVCIPFGTISDVYEFLDYKEHTDAIETDRIGVLEAGDRGDLCLLLEEPEALDALMAQTEAYADQIRPYTARSATAFPIISGPDEIAEAIYYVANRMRRYVPDFRILDAEISDEVYEGSYIPESRWNVGPRDLDPPEYWAEPYEIPYREGWTRIGFSIDGIPVSMKIHWTQEPLDAGTAKTRVLDVTEFTPQHVSFGSEEGTRYGLDSVWEDIVDDIVVVIDAADAPEELLVPKR